MSDASYHHRTRRWEIVTLLNPVLVVVHWHRANLARNAGGCCPLSKANDHLCMTMHAGFACGNSLLEGKSFVDIRMTGLGLGIALVHLLVPAQVGYDREMTSASFHIAGEGLFAGMAVHMCL